MSATLECSPSPAPPQPALPPSATSRRRPAPRQSRDPRRSAVRRSTARLAAPRQRRPADEFAVAAMAERRGALPSNGPSQAGSLPRRAPRPAPPRSSARRRRFAETGSPPQARPVRLTARGRFAVTTAVGIVAAVVLVVAFSIGRGSAAASAGVAQPAPSAAPATIVVGPADTLWTLAARVAPNADRRATIDRILRLNALAGAAVRPGQTLLVPASTR